MVGEGTMVERRRYDGGWMDVLNAVYKSFFGLRLVMGATKIFSDETVS